MDRLGTAVAARIVVVLRRLELDIATEDYFEETSCHYDRTEDALRRLDYLALFGTHHTSLKSEWDQFVNELWH